MTKLSIIIPTLNEELSLQNNLKRLKDHLNGIETEIIVSIASSNTDNTAVIAERLGCLTVSCQTCGRAAQLNAGAAIATGDVLFFLHADAVPPLHFDRHIKEQIDSAYQAGCFSYKFDSKHPLLKINAFFTTYYNRSTGGGDQGLFILKSVFEKIGKYDIANVIMEDFEIMRRIRRQNIKFIVIDRPMMVSARKYEKNSYLRVNLVNLWAVILFRRKVAPAKIKAFCDKYLR